MALTYVLRTNYDIFDIVTIALLLISFIYLILEGKSLKRREKMNIPHYFVYIGYTCLAWTIISLLIPTITGTHPYTDQENQEAFIFALLFYSLIPNLIYFSTLGWMMRSIGIKNAEFQGKKLAVIGIIMMGSYLMISIRNVVFYFFLFFATTEFSQMSFLLSFISLGISILILIAAALFLKFSIEVNEGMLLISSGAFLIARIVIIVSSIF